MSDIKVFATPEAYELLTNISNGKKTKSAVEAAFRLMTEKICVDSFIQGCPVALSAYWSESSSEDSIILLDNHKGFQLGYDFGNYKVFFEKLKTALPISLS